MTAYLTLDALALCAPDGRLLFENLTLSLGAERLGLVGRNGCGKSTLLRAIAGEVEPLAGAILRAGSIGVLAQTLGETEALDHALGVREALSRLRRLEAGQGTLEDAAEADWTLEARIEAALAEAGLPPLDLARPVSSLSGGERTRLAIARLLIEAPDVILLDEPTNNLDVEGRRSVADLLARWRGGAIIASHDRALLEHVDRIVELSPTGASVFTGGWTAFEAARHAARERASAELESAAQSLKQTERRAQAARERQDRSDAAGRAKRAKGDAPKILLDAKADRADRTAGRGARLAVRQTEESAERLDAARARVEILTPQSFDLPPVSVPTGRELLALREVVVTRDGRRLFGPLTFDLRGPARVAVRGRNGAGKTTLLSLITGETTPTSGEILRLTPHIASLDQHVTLLDPGASILDNLRRLNPGADEHEARALLARFAFRNTQALRLVGTLSGGERMRAGLACVFARPQPPQILLLDEPTNHLDLAATQELERALTGFGGAIIVVSHDERFLQAIGADQEIRLDSDIQPTG